MKMRHDFVSNSSSCSFFVWLKSQDDVIEFKKLIDDLKNMNATMQTFKSLADANDRWYGDSFTGTPEQIDELAPGQFILCDSGEDHYSGYEERFWRMKSLFLDGKHKFKLFSDIEAHMSSGDDLPKVDRINEFFEKNWD